MKSGYLVTINVIYYIDILALSPEQAVDDARQEILRSMERVGKEIQDSCPNNIASVHMHMLSEIGIQKRIEVEGETN